MKRQVKRLRRDVPESEMSYDERNSVAKHMTGLSLNLGLAIVTAHKVRFMAQVCRGLDTPLGERQ